MRVLASGSIFFESGTVDLLGNCWFPGHFEKKWKSQIWVDFFFDRKLAQKHKRLYQNWSPRSGTKLKKIKKIEKLYKIDVSFFVPMSQEMLNFKFHEFSGTNIKNFHFQRDTSL